MFLGLAQVGSQAADEDESSLPADPVQCGVGCYGSDLGPNVLSRTGLGDFQYSPTVAHVGEQITGRIDPAVHFGINVLMTWPVGAPGAFIRAKSTPQAEPTNYPSYAGDWHVAPAPDEDVCAGKANTRSVTACTWKATSVTGPHWAVATATIGNPPARGVTQAYFAILAHGYGITGRVTLADGKGVPGVAVSISGDKNDQWITNSNGSYRFVVPAGSYTVSAGQGFCVEPRGSGDCKGSKKVNVPSSQTVDFKASGEGTISGIATDSDNKPMAGVLVHARGPGGRVMTTDNTGHYFGKFRSGTFTVSAQATVDVNGTDINGVATTYHRSRRMCVSGTGGRNCQTAKTVRITPDQTVNLQIDQEQPVAKIVQIREVHYGGLSKAEYARPDKWYTAFESMDVFIGDKIRTDDNTVLALEFVIGGRVGVNKGSVIQVVDEAHVLQNDKPTVRRFAIRQGGMWAKMAKRGDPLEIQTNGGVTGQKG